MNTKDLGELRTQWTAIIGTARKQHGVSPGYVKRQCVAMLGDSPHVAAIEWVTAAEEVLHYLDMEAEEEDR